MKRFYIFSLTFLDVLFWIYTISYDPWQSRFSNQREQMFDLRSYATGIAEWCGARLDLHRRDLLSRGLKDALIPANGLVVQPRCN